MATERVAVIGLGYVGLPLAVALARRYPTVGFDINEKRVSELRQHHDNTKEVSPAELNASTLALTADQKELAGCTIYIVTVPTPIDETNRPDFTAILRACEIAGSVLSPGAVVVFESTVYPGVTEEIFAPALEKASSLRSGIDFTLGYRSCATSTSLTARASARSSCRRLRRPTSRSRASSGRAARRGTTMASTRPRILPARCGP
jgi:UDP-N-acetyl-D-galactosamine dehydrogenase